MVGLTVLGGLIILGWMSLRFGDAPARLFATPQIPVHFVSDRADGLDEGSNITYRGVRVGMITKVRRAADEQHIIIEAMVDKSPPLPANMQGLIRSVGIVGSGATMNLDLIGKEPQGHLKPDQELPAKFIGLDLLPPEFAELASELKKTSQQLRESNVIDDLDKTVNTARTQLEKAGKVMDELQGVVGDQKLRDDLRVSMANIRETTENASRLSKQLETVVSDAGSTIKSTQGHVDDLAKQMSARLEQVSKVLESFQSISSKIDSGKGTAGLLVNDPKLYAGLVDAVAQLNLTIKDLQRLALQWEQEGVSLKLGK